MEGINPNNLESILSFSSVDSLKTEFQKRLNDILYKKLSVENIETFADEALAETIALVDDILHQYQNNPNFEKDSALTGKAAEDDAFHKLDLPDLPAFLDSVVEVKEKIDSLKRYIVDSRLSTDRVITPPQPNETIGSELNADEENRLSDRPLFPRLLTLIYLLEQDLDIPREDISITEGAVRPDMIRQVPYVRVSIPDLERLVYICDEEGNASYVFNTAILKENGFTFDQLDKGDKADKAAIIKNHVGSGVRIIQNKSWNRNMIRVLSEPIPKPEEDLDTEDDKEKGLAPRSEFKREERTFLSFEDFQMEVRSLYQGAGDIKAWYQEEKRNHLNSWHSRPDHFYKGKGWKSWPELIGKEKVIHLSFADFQREVRSLYQGASNKENWYHEEKNKHHNWPFNPDVTYKNTGWVGYPELVGKERIIPLSFVDFKREVRSLYQGASNKIAWYVEEKNKHPNWPLRPDRIYKNTGWIDWSDLVGKEGRKTGKEK